MKAIVSRIINRVTNQNWIIKLLTSISSQSLFSVITLSQPSLAGCSDIFNLQWLLNFLTARDFIDFNYAIYCGSIRLPFWVSMEKYRHSILKFSNEFCYCDRWVHLPGSEVCEWVGVYKTVESNTVMCKSIDYKLLSWILWNIGQYIMLVRRVLVCTS